MAYYTLSPMPQDARVAAYSAAWPIRQRPIWVVVLLTIFSLGFYLPVWYGQSWSELKRIVRDPGMSPFWHALTLYVPIYSWFRMHSHFSLINEQSALRSLPVGVGAAAAVSGIIAGSALSTVFIGVFLTAAVMVSGQRALNRIWEREFGSASQRRACLGEWVAVLVLPILLVATIAALVSSPVVSPRLATFTGECRGWSEFLPNYHLVVDRESKFWADLNSDDFATQSDFGRWSASARSLRAQYASLAYPPALKTFGTHKDSAFRDYVTGFAAIAAGDNTFGDAYVKAGDRLLQQADTELATANAKCAS